MARNLVHLQRLIAADTPDAELLRRFVDARDELAFAELLQRHLPHVHRICRRQLDATTAEDAVQATFIVFACRAHRIRKAASLGSWLIGVAYRVSRQLRRKRQRQHELMVELPDLPASPDDPISAHELASVLDEELAKLPDHLRDVLVECCLHERTYDDVAKLLGSSPRTVRRRLVEAKQRLRRRLEARGLLPIVAIGLASGLGRVSIAVPPTLATTTFDAAMNVLVGGGLATPPILLAKGMLMNYTMKAVAKSVVAVCVAVGAIGWAIGDDPKPPAPRRSDPPPFPAPQLNKTATPANPPKMDLPKVNVPQLMPPTIDPPPPTPLPPENPFVSGTLSEKAASAPQPPSVPKLKTGIQRAIEAEMNYQRQYFANHLFNNVRSAAPPPAAPPHTREMKYEVRSATPQHTLEVKYERAAVTDQYLMATFRFDQNTVENLPVHITYRGFLDDVITEAVPMSMVVLTYHEHVGKPLPKWAFHSLPLVIQARRAMLVKLDEELRKKLKDGKAHTLSMLFDSKGDEDTTAQAVSILRYLTWRHSTQIEKNKPTNEQALVRFLVRGQLAGWEVAAREQYGFLTLDEMQSLWIEWLKSPASRFTDAAPNLIPSLSLPIPKPKYIAPISVDEPIAPNLDKGDEGAPKPVPGRTIPRIPEKR